MHKAKGMVRDVFRTRNMRALPGNVGLGQVRYPTAGNAYSEEEAQPFYVNAPFGIVLVHNGNLTNAQALKARAVRHRPPPHQHRAATPRCCSTCSRTSSRRAARGVPLHARRGVRRGARVHRRVAGSYAVVALIAGHGLLAFRDPFGIRPLVDGRAAPTAPVMVASESVALEGTGHTFERDVAPGEAIFIDLAGQGPRAAVRREAEAQSLHLRVRLPGAARLGAWTASRSTRRA